jgi:flagellin
VANLVSGKRADANVADLSVGTILATRVGTLRVTVGNAGQAKSLLETAKGALDTVLSLLQQQKNLAVKSADDSLTNNERGFLNQEFQAIVSEIDRISTNANFNGKALLDGSISGVSTVDTATGLSTDNFGIISAGATEVKGTVASGNLATAESKFATNKITITTNGDAGIVGTLTVRDEANANSAAVTFDYGSDINTTINNLVSAFNSFSGTNAKTAQNFTVTNNGDNSFSIKAKESGTQFDLYDFQLGTASGTAVVAGIGVDNATEDVVGSALAFNSSTSITGTDTAIAVNGTFSTIASYNVGQTTGISQLAITALDVTTASAFVLTITDVNGVVGAAGATATINFTSDANATPQEYINSIIEVVNGATTPTAATLGSIGGSGDAASDLAILRSFAFEKVSGTQINIAAAKAGTAYDGFTFDLTTNGGITTAGNATFNGGNAGAASAALAFNSGTQIQVGADRAVSTTDATIDTNLKGGFSNFTANFIQGSGSLATSGQAVERNQVTFSVEINNTTYVSEPVFLHGGFGGTALAAYGNTIAANQEIVFYDPSGPKDSSGNLTNNAFVFRVGSSAITLSDLSTASKALESANLVAAAFETQLAGVTINQDRSLSLAQVDASSGDHRIAAAVGTVLEGIRGFDSVGTNVASYNGGDIKLLTDNYSVLGTLGDIGSFDVDRLRNTITTSIDGIKYTAYLSSDDLPDLGNVVAFGTNLDGTSNVGSYNATTKILDLQDGTTSAAATSVLGSAKLNFFSASTTDGRVLSIDLGNVSNFTSQLNISSAEGELGLESALNGIFGVASNESLTFQVGAASTDVIGVSIGSAKSTSIYKDDDGVAQVISVDTIENAIKAGNIVDNAINSVVSLISDIAAKITSFNSAIQNNQASIQNADAARSKLIDTDYTQESTRFAEARVRVDAATAVLTQVNSRIQNLLGLLQQ